MISVKFKNFKECIEFILPQPSTRFQANQHLLLEFTVKSNKENFLGDYIEYLIKNDVFILFFTQEGNTPYYLHNISNYHIMAIELTVLDSRISRYEFKTFGQIPLNESKILYLINNVIQELDEEKKLLIIFDSLSDIILWFDFNTAYKFMRKVVSNLRRANNVSSIFLINKKIHSEQVLSAFESLFDGIFISEAMNECTVKGVIKYRYIIH